MKQYNPSNLAEIKKLYFLVHPFWGYYAGSPRFDYLKHELMGEANPLYGQLLKLEWARKGPERIPTIQEVEEFKQKIRQKYGYNEQFIEELAQQWFVDNFFRNATSREVEKYFEKVDGIYRKTIDEAVAKKDSAFVIVALPNFHSGKKQMIQREHHYSLLKYAKVKLGSRAIVLEGHFKPATFFKLLASRGFKLSKRIQIEAFGEIAKDMSTEEPGSCVQDELEKFVENLSKMREHVENGTIFSQKELGNPKVWHTASGETILEYANGRKVEIDSQKTPKWLKYKKPVSTTEDVHWINLAKSGIPLKGMKKFAARMPKK